MKKIILQGGNKEININSLEEVENIHDIVTELIIPSFQAFGFDKETILDGLDEYIMVHRPTQEEPCDKCKGFGEDLSLAYKDNENLVAINQDFSKRIEQLIEENEQYNQEVEGLVKVIESYEKFKNQPPVEGQREPDIENIVCENCNGEFHPDEIVTGETVCEDCYMALKEQEKEEKYRCPECEQDFIADEMDGDLCTGCEEYRTTCPNCGGHTETDYSDCQECEEQAERDYEEEMEDLGENEGDCIQTQPEDEVWNTTSGNDTWTTEDDTKAWKVPPADDKPVEPEQDDIIEPERLTCGNCGLPVDRAMNNTPFCPKCDTCQKCNRMLLSDGTCKNCREEVVKNCQDCGHPLDDNRDGNFCGDSSACIERIETPVKVNSYQPCPNCGRACQTGINYCTKCNYSFVEKPPENGDVCGHCGNGRYQEYHPNSDMYGEYRCPACGDTIYTKGQVREEKDYSKVYYCKICDADLYPDDKDLCKNCVEAPENQPFITMAEPIKPPSPPEPVKPSKADFNTYFSEGQKEKNYGITTKGKADAQIRADNGDWDFPYQTSISCKNASTIFPNIDCSKRNSCRRCPVTFKDVEEAKKNGLYFCPDCSGLFKKPFPIGYCPNCGLHEGEDNREGQDEYCGLHWDVHRKLDDYEADEEENFKDDDLCQYCRYPKDECECEEDEDW